ncbi:MAG TPA: DUF6268 family outer membrane beta-barrel protein, partial [Planctomycetota bacterium]|nr:DUF6268 family outer membrane beta-barrel protein [Planctomycetota bacterium]
MNRHRTLRTALRLGHPAAVLLATWIVVSAAVPGMAQAVEEPVPTPAPTPAEPDAVPPGETAPWVPAVPPPAADEPAADEPATAPAVPTMPAPAPAPAPAPQPSKADAPPSVPPDDRALDLHFLDFLVPKTPKRTWHLIGGFESVATAGVKSAGSQPTVGTATTEIGFGIKEYKLTWKRMAFDWDFNNASVFETSHPGFPTPPASIGHGRDPWQALNSLSLGWFKFSGYKPRWWVVMGLGLNANYEKEMKDCFSAFGLFQFVHQLEPDWNVSFGVILIVSRPAIVPLPTVSVVWHKDTKSGWSVSIGFPEIQLGYHFNERFQVRTKFIEGGGDTFRLADHNPIAPKGYLELKAAKTGLEAEWTPVKDLSVTL